MADPAEPRYRWRLDGGGERRWTGRCTLEEAQRLAQREFPPPAVVLVIGLGHCHEVWRREGGEPNDGGGYRPVEWRQCAEGTR